jgi:hypothetical protein
MKVGASTLLFSAERDQREQRRVAVMGLIASAETIAVHARITAVLLCGWTEREKHPSTCALLATL